MRKAQWVVCLGVVLGTGCSADSDVPGGSTAMDPAPASMAGAGAAGTAASAAGTGAAASGTAGSGAAGSDTAGSGTAGSGVAGSGTAGAGTAGAGFDAGVVEAPRFSFFVTSLEAMRRLSGSQDGFGGNLGGLEGADRICQDIAASVEAGQKTWRAFLSVTSGPDGQPVHAIERIGQGPWYDRNGRLVAMDIAGLLQERPGGDPQSVDDLPDENGIPLSTLGDSHDVLTGSDTQGRLASTDPADTCQDWTSAQAEGSGDMIMCGHSWPRCADPTFGMLLGGCDGAMDGGTPQMPGFFGGGMPGGGFGNFGNGSNWISDHPVHGCEPGVNLVQNGPGDLNKRTVGEGGGWGGIYCFALTP